MNRKDLGMFFALAALLLGGYLYSQSKTPPAGAAGVNKLPAERALDELGSFASEHDADLYRRAFTQPLMSRDRAELCRHIEDADLRYRCHEYDATYGDKMRVAANDIGPEGRQLIERWGQRNFLVFFRFKNPATGYYWYSYNAEVSDAPYLPEKPRFLTIELSAIPAADRPAFKYLVICEYRDDQGVDDELALEVCPGGHASQFGAGYVRMEPGAWAKLPLYRCEIGKAGSRTRYLYTIERTECPQPDGASILGYVGVPDATD